MRVGVRLSFCRQILRLRRRLGLCLRMRVGLQSEQETGNSGFKVSEIGSFTFAVEFSGFAPNLSCRNLAPGSPISFLWLGKDTPSCVGHDLRLMILQGLKILEHLPG